MSDFCRRAVLGGLSSLCITHIAMAQPAIRKPEYRIFDMPPGSHNLSCWDVTVDDRDYRLFMALPKGEAPPEGWPSIWMLDGNAVFDRISRDYLTRYPQLAVIGIGYPGNWAFDGVSRALDYTPPSPFPDQRQRNPTGGADDFRDRLLGPLRKHVEAKAPLDPARRTIWGHSYGGLFTLYCLLTEPEAFTAWVAASPSSSFADSVLREILLETPQIRKTAPVHILLGDHEHRRGTDVSAIPKPSPETMAIADMLRERSDLDIRVTVLTGLGHGATFLASFPAAFDLAAAK